MNMKHFLIFTVAVSFLASSCKIFEIDEAQNDVSYYGYFIQATVFNLGLLQTSTLFQVVFLIHYLLNDFVLILANLIVDILLVCLIRRDLRLKVDFKANSQTHETEDYKKTLLLVKQTEKSTNKMIIYSSMVYIICRLPELAFNVHLMFLKDEFFPDLYLTLCKNILCIAADNIIQYFYMTSYIVNIFFFYKFNKQFRFGLRSYFKLKKPKK